MLLSSYPNLDFFNVDDSIKLYQTVFKIEKVKDFVKHHLVKCLVWQLINEGKNPAIYKNILNRYRKDDNISEAIHNGKFLGESSIRRSIKYKENYVMKIFRNFRDKPFNNFIETLVIVSHMLTHETILNIYSYNISTYKTLYFEEFGISYLSFFKTQSFNEKIKSLLEIAEAIKHLHSFDIPHGNIKMNNIYKINDKMVINDGIFKNMIEDEYTSLFDDPFEDNFKPPELNHIDGSKKINKNSDIWQFGLLINHVMNEYDNYKKEYYFQPRRFINHGEYLPDHIYNENKKVNNLILKMLYTKVHFSSKVYEVDINYNFNRPSISEVIKELITL